MASVSTGEPPPPPPAAAAAAGLAAAGAATTTSAPSTYLLRQYSTRFAIYLSSEESNDDDSGLFGEGLPCFSGSPCSRCYNDPHTKVTVAATLGHKMPPVTKFPCRTVAKASNHNAWVTETPTIVLCPPTTPPRFPSGSCTRAAKHIGRWFSPLAADQRKRKVSVPRRSCRYAAVPLVKLVHICIAVSAASVYLIIFITQRAGCARAAC